MRVFFLFNLFFVVLFLGCKKNTPTAEQLKTYKEVKHRFPNKVTKKENVTGLGLNIPFHYVIENVNARFREELRTNTTPSKIFGLGSNLTTFNGFDGSVYLIENSQADAFSMDKIFKKHSSRIKSIEYQDAESIVFRDRYMVYKTVFYRYIAKERVHIIFESTNVMQGNDIFNTDGTNPSLLSQGVYDLQVAKTLFKERAQVKLDTVSWKSFKNDLTRNQLQTYKNVASQIATVADTISLDCDIERPYEDIVPYIGMIKVQEKSPLLTIFNTTSSDKEISRLLSKEAEIIDYYTARDYGTLLVKKDKKNVVIALSPIYLSAPSDYVYVSLSLYTNKRGEQVLIYVFPQNEAMAYFYSKFFTSIKNINVGND
ncbi:hypothetical protein [uncultured Marixanthomonas sp.]|uniref:hypothetical protein n=1 Tax=uncultured Marixanthomonas sp. TaxID=757245 RepID=UPI0030D985BD|tara:strand:- start:64529 stop:65641 length:1113 start_codon:yes stop_codon:yes gene_type:complete